MPSSNAKQARRASQQQPLGSRPTNSRSASHSIRHEQPRQTSRDGNNRSKSCAVNKKKSIAINKTIVALGEAQNWEGILGVFQKEKDAFDCVNYSTVIVQLSKQALLGETEQIARHPKLNSFLDSLANNIVEQGLEWIGVRQAANSIHAIAKMGLCNGSAKRILDWLSTKENAELFIATADTTQNVANTAWAFATLGTPAPAFFSKLDAESAWFVKNATPQDVANVAWACAKLKTLAPNFFAKLDAASDWFFNNGNTQDVANVAWACAELKTPAPAFFSRLDAESDGFFKNGNTQTIANVAWACAKLKTPAPTFFSKLDSASDWFVKNATPQEVANVAWAYATLDTPAPAFFSRVDAESDGFFKNGSTQTIANVAWACAKLKTPAPTFFSKLDTAFDRFVKNADPQGVANVAWAYATLATPAPTFFSRLDAESKWFVNTGNTQNIANVAWAYAILGQDASTVFSAIESGINPIVENAGLQHLSSVCFAVAAADHVEKSMHMLRTLWDRAMQLFPTEVKSWEDKSFCQLAQTKFFADAYNVELPACPEMVELMEEAMKAMSAEHNAVSKAGRKVSNCLKSIGFEHECEVPPSNNFWGGFLAIDIACKDRKVAIEFDGPSHFINAAGIDSLTTQRNGSTKAKCRLLKLLRWKVISLDFREFRDAEARGRQHEYLREKLANVGVELPKM